LDETYVLHTHHWRDASSYVALTRARHSTQVFVAREEARDLPELAIQMARQSNRSATIAFEVTSGAEDEGQLHVKRGRALSRGDERQ
jgi:hypothetical protein